MSRKRLIEDTLTITPEILGLIAGIDEFKGAWRALGAIAPERLQALRRVATIESIGSSTRIEGAKLSDREVERLLSKLEIKSFATRDEQEVAGYAEVMDLVFQSYSEISITENYIRQLHRDLLRYSTKDDRHRGSYKTTPNHVAAFDEQGSQIGVVFETASPFETPGRMAELISWFQGAQAEKRLHPLLIVAIFIVIFLEIHPFQDGNGRLSRILTTLMLLRAGYAYVPYASLESVIEQSKESYYLAAKIEREKIVVAQLPELSVRILDFAREHGRVSTGDIVRTAGASRNTLKQQFRQLVERGYLARHGGGRTTWYTLR
jgi:Fic family protein